MSLVIENDPEQQYRRNYYANQQQTQQQHKQKQQKQQQQQQTQQQKQKNVPLSAEMADYLITEREKEIDTIHDEVLVVNEIMRDLTDLIKEQDEHVFEATNNIKIAHEQSSKGVKELEKAQDNQKAGCLLM